MFSYLSFFSTEFDTKAKEKVGLKSVVIAEALFFVWVGLFAGLTFLVTLVLGLLGVLSLKYIIQIYAGISAVTVLLATLLYFLRGK